MTSRRNEQVTGFIDQTQINIEADDEGGELDPHGADQRGNPLGSLMFSTAFGQENTSSQVNGSWITQGAFTRTPPLLRERVLMLDFAQSSNG